MDVEAVVKNRSGEQGYTLNELMVLLSVILLIVGLAVPGVLRRLRQARNEASAIALVKTIAASQEAYSKRCGSGGYAVDFAVLGKPTVQAEAGFIPVELSQTESLRKNGYDFTLDAAEEAVAGPLDCHGIPTHTAFLITAQPVKFGLVGTGTRSFSMTSQNILWETRAAVARVR